MKKLILLLTVVAGVSFNAVSEVYSSQQLIPAGHWVYEALTALELETKCLSIADNAPLSVLEIRHYLSLVDYDSLSYSGKVLYDKTKEYLTEPAKKIDLKPVKIGVNLEINPVFMGKTNKEIDWSVSTDYTGKEHDSTSYKNVSQLKHFNLKFDDTQKKFVSVANSKEGSFAGYMTNGYVNGATYTDSEFSAPLIVVPLYFDFGDKFLIETQPSLGTSQFGLLREDLYAYNLKANSNDLDFYIPRVANASFGHLFDSGWGYNFHVARSGLQIGNSMTGSVIYSSNFDTNVYFHSEVFSRRFKYEMNVAEINHSDNQEKFLYLHSLEVLPFKWLRFAVTEGTMINGGFSLRYMNPLMILHSFGTWTELNSEWEDKVYGEAHTCAYMALQLEFLLGKYTRFYILYAQDEIQPPTELTSDSAYAVPDGYGYQVGIDVKIPESRGGWYTAGIEGIYTTPWLYIKQAKEWSLYSYRYNMQSDSSVPVCSWIGTPFGPDAIGFQTKFGYKKPEKWNVEGDYLFLAHGTHSFGIFSEYDVYTDEFGNTYVYNSYYPAVKYKAGLQTADEARCEARDLRLTGTVQFTNQVAFKGSYTLNKHVTFNGKMIYEFIFNNHNEIDNFQQGLELSLGANLKLY